MSFLIVLLAILPIIIICKYINSKDKNKEPICLLIILFVCGIISTYITIYLTNILYELVPIFKISTDNMNLILLFIYSFVSVGLIEEFSKWIFLYLVGYNNKEYDEIYDMIVYSVFVSLGFACYENILYTSFGLSFEESLVTAIVRGISAVPAHACNAVFMGYYLTIAKMYKQSKKKYKEKEYIIKSILIPAFLHSIYDFCLLSGYLVFIILFIVFVIWLYKETIYKIKEIQDQNSKVKIKQSITCKVCGAEVNSNYCEFCGEKVSNESINIYRRTENNI